MLNKGHTFMGWGTSSYFTEYGPGGTVMFDGCLKPGTSSYRAFKETWTGTPTTAPSLAAVRNGAGSTVYASWNFATEVAGWVVFAGPNAHDLTPAGVADVAGFETAIALPHAHRYVAVQAIDAKGSVLGKSKALKV
jgi:hypothetical protein